MNSEQGNVIAEFIGVIVGLMIPVMFIASACGTFVSTELALRNASESMARAYVVSPTTKVGMQRARTILRATLASQGITPGGVKTKIICSSSPCLTAGSTVTFTLSRKVTSQFPGLGRRTLTLTQAHTATVDDIR